MNINIGIDSHQRQAVADALSRLLADSYTLYLKTHNFHWNVTGPSFVSLHELFEVHYTELATAVDDIAERIRALGCYAPGSYKEFSTLTQVKEATGKLSSDEMVAQLVEAHETVIRTAREAFQIAADAKDEVTVGLLADRMTVHEKAAWMLRSLIEESA